MRNLPSTLRGFCLLPLALASAVLLLLAACAAPEARHESSFERGLIWRVEGAGDKPSYVFGTMHSADARLRRLPPEVSTAFDAARIAAFELDDSRMSQTELAKSIQLPPDQRLEDILGPKLYQRAAEIVTPLGLPAEMLQKLKPWVLVTVLILPTRETLRPELDGQSLDRWLQAEARRHGKTVYGLETVSEQLAIFEEMSEADQIAMVADLVNHYPEVKAQHDRLLHAYLAGDAAALAAEAAGRSGTMDVMAAIRFHQRAIVDRNRVMVERMLPLMAQDATFVAVGAAHLGGEAGILRLLEQRGYRVTRVH